MTRHARRSGRMHLAGMIPFALMLVLAPAEIVPARAQTPVQLHNDKISVDYYEPRTRSKLPLYRRLQERAVLERLSEFLAPIQWPKRLRLIMKECPADAPWPPVYYAPLEYSLNLCYQWFEF